MKENTSEEDGGHYLGLLRFLDQLVFCGKIVSFTRKGGKK